MAADEGDWNKFRSLFPDNDGYEAWEFTRLHKITLNIIAGDLEQALLEPDIDVDRTDSEGRTALIWATKRHDARAMDLLIRAKASVNKADNQGRTPLMSAGSLSCLKPLLEAGADAKAVNHYNLNVLHLLSSMFGRFPKDISSKGVSSENCEAIRLLVSKGSALEGRDSTGSTPLSHSVLDGNVSWLEAFLDCGGDPNSLDNEGDTPLNNAIFYQADTCLALLLQCGATYNLLNNKGDSVLHRAARWANLQILGVLDAANLRDIDTETVNKKGKTANQEAEEREQKPEGFLENFEALLAGIRSRRHGHQSSPAGGGSMNEGRLDGLKDEFLDAPEYQ